MSAISLSHHLKTEKIWSTTKKTTRKSFGWKLSFISLQNLQELSAEAVEELVEPEVPEDMAERKQAAVYMLSEQRKLADLEHKQVAVYKLAELVVHLPDIPAAERKQVVLCKQQVAQVVQVVLLF